MTADPWLRVVDRLPGPTLAALCGTWPEVLAAIARERTQGGVGQVLDFEPRRVVEQLMRERPAGPARRTA